MNDPENATSKRHPVDWKEPWIDLLVLLNLLLRDSVGAIAIVGLSHAVEYVIDVVSGRPWTWSAGNIEIRPSDIVHYADLAILVGFVALSVYEVSIWMRKR